MKVLIVEPEFEGHHISLYLRLILKEMIKKNIEFRIFTTKKTISSQPFKLIDNELSIKKKTLCMQGSISLKNKSLLNLILFQIRYFLFIRRNLKFARQNFKYDVVYFGHLDPFIFIFSIFSNFFQEKIITGLLCNIRFYQSAYKIKKFEFIDIIKFFLFNLSLYSSRLKKIFIVDELFFKYLNKKLSKSLLNKVTFVSEACHLLKTSSNNFRYKFRIKKRDKVILLYGDLKKRKGVVELIKITKNKNFPKNIKIILAGKQSNDVKNFVKKKVKNNKSQNIIIFNKFLNYREESNFFDIANVVWLAYSGGSDGSSGVLKQAALAGKPIIETGRGLISWINKKYKIGININLENEDNSIKKIKKLLLDNNEYSFYKKNINKYSKKINEKKFSYKIVNEIIKIKKVQT